MFSKFLCAVLFIILMTGCGDSEKQNPVDGNHPAEFADAHLEESVCDALGNPIGELTEDELLPLTHLDASGREIADLDGIGQMLHLEVLDLSGNQIRNIAPLSTMTRLCTLNLSDNQVQKKCAGILPGRPMGQRSLSFQDLRGMAISTQWCIHDGYE